jgi:hypothetical protein
MMHEEPLINNGWSSFDPVDGAILERLSKKDSLTGEEKLILAVLEHAIEYFQKYVLAKRENEKKLFHEAEDWILDKNSDGLYSFENICEVLGLHPDYMRQGLMDWKEARLKHHAKRLNLHRTRRH